MYYYLQRSASLSNNKKIDETDMIRAFGILENTLGAKYSRELKEKSVSDLLYGVLLMMCKAGKSNKEICAYIDLYEKKYPEWWQCGIIKKMGKAKALFLIAARMRSVSVMKAMAGVHDKMIC